MIVAANNVSVGVSGDGEEILNVIERRQRAIWEEDGLDFGAIGCAYPEDR